MGPRSRASPWKAGNPDGEGNLKPRSGVHHPEGQAQVYISRFMVRPASNSGERWSCSNTRGVQ